MEYKEKEVGQLSKSTNSKSHRNRISFDLNEWFVDIDDAKLQLEESSSQDDKSKNFGISSISYKDSQKNKRSVLRIVAIILLIAICVIGFFLIRDSIMIIM